MENLVLLVIPVIFISAFIRSALGFGDALIAMPLLSLFLPLNMATPIVGLAAISYSALILYKDWRKVHVKSVIILVLTGFLGIPIGIILLKENHESLLKIILGVIIVLFSLFNLLKPRLVHLKTDKLAFLFGFVSGVLGGAYNTNGPPIVIYSVLRRWEPSDFRATMQGYFLPTGFMIAVGHGISGLWTKTVLLHFLVLIPAILIGLFLGNMIHKRIKKERFNNYIFVALIIIGSWLILENTGL